MSSARKRIRFSTTLLALHAVLIVAAYVTDHPFAYLGLLVSTMITTANLVGALDTMKVERSDAMRRHPAGSAR